MFLIRPFPRSLSLFCRKQASGLGHVVPPAVPAASSGPSTRWTCPRRLSEEVFRKNLGRNMPPRPRRSLAAAQNPTSKNYKCCGQPREIPTQCCERRPGSYTGTQCYRRRLSKISPGFLHSRKTSWLMSSSPANSPKAHWTSIPWQSGF